MYAVDMGGIRLVYAGDKHGICVVYAVRMEGIVGGEYRVQSTGYINCVCKS